MFTLLTLEFTHTHTHIHAVYSDIEGFAYNDDEDDFGPCSVTCGCGVERRNISCFATINGVLTNETVDDRFCEDLNLKRPDETRVCTLDDCPIWVINGTFGPVHIVVF